MKVVLFINKHGEVSSIVGAADDGLEYPSKVKVMHVSIHSDTESEWWESRLQRDIAFDISSWLQSGGDARVYDSVEEAAEATEHPISSYILRLL